MIAGHQPTIFGREVIAGVSSKQDGNVKFDGVSDEKVVANRRAFLEKVGIAIDHTSLVSVTYDTKNFAKYRIATVDDKAVGMLASKAMLHADALVVTQPNHALFLPLADCVGAIIYDPINKVLMVSHLGRHSVEIQGAQKSIQYLEEQFHSSPADLLVWLSPAVGKASYPLHAFRNRSLHEVIGQQLAEAGVAPRHIEISSVDTAADENYFSHSEYLKGNKHDGGRFAVVAQMIGQGEPAV